jgi:predicted metalloprotease
MRWQIGRQSSNIEDRRGMSPGGGMFGGRGGFGGGWSGGGLGGGGIGRRGGIGGVAFVILILAGLFFGFDPFQDSTDTGYSPAPAVQTSAPGDEQGRFVSAVLADTEDTWHAIFAQRGATYQEPRLVLFTDAVASACGMAAAASGPFYCPRDHKVYLDTSFFDELARRFGAPGDFAQAYVIAHEVGHHVQALLGLIDRAEGNAGSVRVELQADCFAGIWGHHADRTRHLLEQGDVEEALAAASAIGDDRLQQQAQGYVEPDSFTHGSSEERVRWFKRGFDSGRIEDCDTFGADRP